VLLAPASSHSSGHPASSESPRRGTNSRPAPLPSIPNVPPPGSTHRRAVGHRPVASGGTPIVLWIVLGACVTGAALWWRRRLIDLAGALRRRPARSAVLHSWRRVDRELGRRHPGRFPAETLTEYVERLQGTGGGSLRRVPVPDVVSRLARSPELVELAGMAARACYGDEAPSSDDVARARRLQAELCAAARSRRRVRTPTPGPAHRR
ncbi:MAG TPA: DUF4129 domain-containing protein, partial [Acidimicrobiales bacterium]|nr:DUF4129 domain-containing protein [Acidimicrobiales bacterium]